MLPPRLSNDQLAKRLKGSCDEKYDHAELCECMQGFYSYHCGSMLGVSKTYFAVVNLGPDRRVARNFDMG